MTHGTSNPLIGLSKASIQSPSPFHRNTEKLYPFELTCFLHAMQYPLCLTMLQSAFRLNDAIWSLRIRSEQGILDMSRPD
jgi:hypothetical protein